MFRPEIEDDVETARVWYENQRSGLGDGFRDRVDDPFDTSCRLLTVYLKVLGDLLACQIVRFPYVVSYRVRPTAIEIVAVMHSHRDPGVWQSRCDDSL